MVNDATLEDARQVGLTECVKVIGNGTDIGGTCLEKFDVPMYTGMLVSERNQ